MIKKTFLIAALTALSIAVFADEEWQDASKGFNYESKGFSCKISSNGIFDFIKADGINLVEKQTLHGSYKIVKGEKHDRRFFPRNEKDHPLKLKKDGENKYELKKTGTLSNKKYKPGAKFEQEMELSPNEIEMEFEVETTVGELASQSGIFVTILYLPENIYANRGFKITLNNEKSELKVFPQTFTKESALHISGIKEIMVSLEKGIFKITAGENTSISLQDTRSWGGKAFRLNIAQTIPWKSKPVIFPAGKKFEWSYKMTYKPHE
jgi:hypothetical protein